jgi:5-hydroxyisourate hydrolase
MSPVTTHVLDTSRGRPAEGVVVALERQEPGDCWTEIGRGRTNADGRITNLLPDDATLPTGTFRLRFATAEYFAALGVRGFYPEVLVVFSLEDSRGHYHVPLLLSPFGYSTYRGS